VAITPRWLALRIPVIALRCIFFILGGAGA
jgi:hypothetical protein